MDSQGVRFQYPLRCCGYGYPTLNPFLTGDECSVEVSCDRTFPCFGNFPYDYEGVCVVMQGASTDYLNRLWSFSVQPVSIAESC